jgi:hypothetical protein
MHGIINQTMEAPSFPPPAPSEPFCLSRESSFGVLEEQGSHAASLAFLASSSEAAGCSSKGSALGALYEEGSTGVFRWIEASGQVSQVCFEGGTPNPGHGSKICN